MKRNMRCLFLVMMMLSLLVMSGCDPKNETGGSSAGSSSASLAGSSPSSSGNVAKSSSAAAGKDEKLTIKVYYPNEDGTKLLASTRSVRLDGKDKYTAAMESLMQGATDKGQVTIIPKQAKLRSVKVSDGVAKVDLTQALRKNFVGGSTGEEMLVGSIADTLTEFAEVKKVQILIEGKPIESLSGHMDLSEPIGRMESLLQ
ncbi:MAG: GerMN domain-containing protein [Mitsuokella sp.]